MTGGAFRIELEREAWKPGEELQGRVVFTTDRDLTVHAVRTTVSWIATGKGNTDSPDAPILEDVWALDEPTRKLAPGRTLERPFRVRLPVEPWSFTGQLVRITWFVEASLDVPWAVDPKARQEFDVRP